MNRSHAWLPYFIRSKALLIGKGTIILRTSKNILPINGAGMLSYHLTCEKQSDFREGRR